MITNILRRNIEMCKGSRKNIAVFLLLTISQFSSFTNFNIVLCPIMIKANIWRACNFGILVCLRKGEWVGRRCRSACPVIGGVVEAPGLYRALFTLQTAGQLRVCTETFIHSALHYSPKCPRGYKQNVERNPDVLRQTVGVTGKKP